MTRYELLERIGAGRMAEIFRAKAVAAGGFEKPVVIKRILPHLSSDPRFVEVLIAEAKILSVLRHRNIVQIFDVGVGDDQAYFLVMEYVDGIDLAMLQRGLERRRARLPIDLVLHIGAEICDALDYAQQTPTPDGRPMNLVHRDVSPSNVLVSRSGEVKLTDFGLARRPEDRRTAGGLRGRFGYVSPEQVGGLPVDGRSDVFSLGVIVWELALGRRLFSAMADYEALRAIVDVPILPPSTQDRSLPPELDAILAEALNRDADRRLPSAGELGKRLRGLRYSLESSSGDPASALARLTTGIEREPLSPATLAASASASASGTAAASFDSNERSVVKIHSAEVFAQPDADGTGLLEARRLLEAFDDAETRMSSLSVSFDDVSTGGHSLRAVDERTELTAAPLHLGRDTGERAATGDTGELRDTGETAAVEVPTAPAPRAGSLIDTLRSGAPAEVRRAGAEAARSGVVPDALRGGVVPDALRGGVVPDALRGGVVPDTLRGGQVAPQPPPPVRASRPGTSTPTPVREVAAPLRPRPPTPGRDVGAALRTPLSPGREVGAALRTPSSPGRDVGGVLRAASQALARGDRGAGGDWSNRAGERDIDGDWTEKTPPPGPDFMPAPDDDGGAPSGSPLASALIGSAALGPPLSLGPSPAGRGLEALGPSPAGRGPDAPVGPSLAAMSPSAPALAPLVSPPSGSPKLPLPGVGLIVPAPAAAPPAAAPAGSLWARPGSPVAPHGQVGAPLPGPPVPMSSPLGSPMGSMAGVDAPSPTSGRRAEPAGDPAHSYPPAGSMPWGWMPGPAPVSGPLAALRRWWPVALGAAAIAILSFVITQAAIDPDVRELGSPIPADAGDPPTADAAAALMGDDAGAALALGAIDAGVASDAVMIDDGDAANDAGAAIDALATFDGDAAIITDAAALAALADAGSGTATVPDNGALDAGVTPDAAPAAAAPAPRPRPRVRTTRRPRDGDDDLPPSRSRRRR